MTPRDRKREYARLYREANRLKIRASKRAYRRKLKADVLAHYGKVCARCGFSDMRALQIDHINDDGAMQRKSLGGKQMSGWRFYEYLKLKNYPTGYQTLCANCNNIKQWDKNNTGL